MSNINRTYRINAIIQLLTGFAKHWTLGGLHVNSETLKPKEVTASLQAVIDAAARVAEARGALDAALHDEEVAIAENADIITCLKQVVTNAFKNKPDVLADFGLRKRNRKELTVEEKANAVAKLRATREARGTLGKRQKADIHGDPVVHPASPSPPPPPIVPVLNGANGAAHGG